MQRSRSCSTFWLRGVRLCPEARVSRGSFTSQIAKADRALNTMMARYINHKTPDHGKLLLGLEIMAYRTALANTRQELRLADERERLFKHRLESLEAHYKLASERLDLTAVDIDAIDYELEQSRASRRSAEQEQLEAESEALGSFAELPVDRAYSYLLSQRVILTQARERVLRQHMLFLQAMRSLVLFSGDLSTEDVEQMHVDWREWAQATDQIADEAATWQEESHYELRQASQEYIAASDDQELRKINLDRQDLAQETLAALAELEEEVGNTQIVLTHMDAEFRAQSTWYQRVWATLADWTTAIWPTLLSIGTFTFFKISGVPFSIWSLIKVVITIIVATWISRLFRRYLSHYSRKRYDIVKPKLYTMGRLAHYLIILTAIVVCLVMIGLDFSRLLIVFGALSVGIGFGLQGVVLNFVSGLLILFENHLHVGDVIELEGGERGVVTSIHVQNSVIETFDGIDVVIPNSELVSKHLVNWTMQDPFRRIHVPFDVAYGSDKKHVRQVVLEAAPHLPSTLVEHSAYPNPDVRLIKFGKSSLEFDLLVWVSLESFANYNAMLAAYHWEVDSALVAANIAIPVEQMDLRIKEFPS